MKDEINKLRDLLFGEFFKAQDGIRLEDLMKSLKPVIEVWQKLHIILTENVEFFDKYSSIMQLKVVTINGKHFLVIKKTALTYLIIDLDNNEVLNEAEALKFFKEKFLIENFGERKSKSKEIYQKMFTCLSFEGDISKLINFYVENERILNAVSSIMYRVKFDDAYSFLSIHLSDCGNVLAFRTKDQRLYEHLFFGNDLVPLSLQDAGQKMGYNKMQEILAKIKDIRVPRSLIPESLKQFLVSNVNLDDSRK